MLAHIAASDRRIPARQNGVLKSDAVPCVTGQERTATAIGPKSPRRKVDHQRFYASA
jgi:hypothetical protein